MGKYTTLGTGVVKTGKIIKDYFDESVETFGDVKNYVEDLISKGIIFKGSDLEKMSPEDLMAAKAQRDRILLETQTNKPLTIKLADKQPEEVDIFAHDIVQDTPEPTFNLTDATVTTKKPKLEIPSDKELERFSTELKENALKFDQERLNSIPNEVLDDLMNMPIESNSRLDRSAGVYRGFNPRNEKHLYPLSYEIPESMLKAIDEGRMPLPKRYDSDRYNLPYLQQVINRIAQTEDGPAYTINLLLDDLSNKSISVFTTSKKNKFFNEDMVDQKTILDAYTNFKIRKETALKKEINPAFDFSSTIYNDRGVVDINTFDNYIQLKNKYRKELQQGTMDAEFDPENISSSLNKYPYLDEMLKEPGPITPKFTILEAPVDPNKFIKESKVRNEYYEPFMYSKQEEAAYEKYKTLIKGLQRGHELMRERRIQIFNQFGKDNRILNHVKYPRFFTNIQRNGAHKILEKHLFANRNRFRELKSDIEKMQWLPESAKQSMRDEQKQILATLKNISHDMKELGVETQVIRDNGKGFVKYGKGFKNPEQLIKSINEEQNLKFLTSKMSRSVSRDTVEGPVGIIEDRFFFPEGYKDGGFASLEEVLEY